MNTVIKRPLPLPPRPVTRPVPPETAAEAFGLRRVRSGQSYNIWARSEYDWDAAEARSGLVGHEG